jgi:hypothetical protein
MHFSFLLSMLHAPPISSSFDHPNNIWWSVQVTCETKHFWKTSQMTSWTGILKALESLMYPWSDSSTASPLSAERWRNCVAWDQEITVGGKAPQHYFWQDAAAQALSDVTDNCHAGVPSLWSPSGNWAPLCTFLCWL